MAHEHANPHALRIIHVVDSLERGGLERVVADLAMEQRRAGHDVGVFSILETRGFRAELENAGVPVRIGGKRKAFDRAVLRALRASVTGPRADIVHAHNFTPNYYTATALFGRMHAPTHVVTCHDMGTRLTDRKLRWFFGLSLKRTQRVAMVSDQVYHYYVDSGLVRPERAVTITNGIPVERFRPSAQRRQRAREALGLDESALVIGCVGRLVAIKNHALLLECLPRLVAKHPALIVVLLGGGDLDAKLRARAEELGLAVRVRFEGERPDVTDLLPAFDVFAQPSLSEGLSIALLEASASGLPIVATDVGGNREIVQEGATGLLVPSGDAHALGAALDALLSDPPRRRAYGAAAASWAEEHASVATMRTRYDALYRDALGIA